MMIFNSLFLKESSNGKIVFTSCSTSPNRCLNIVIKFPVFEVEYNRVVDCNILNFICYCDRNIDLYIMDLEYIDKTDYDKNNIPTIKPTGKPIAFAPKITNY